MATSPKNPKEYNLSSLFPYNLEENEDGFTFVTDGGTLYQLAFRSDSKYFPGLRFAESLFSFSITVITGDILADPRIEDTVADILNQLFEASPAAIITYTCSLDGNYDRHRRITFGRWYAQWGDGFARIIHNDKASRLYVAAIFRDDHPNKSDIEANFYRVYRDKDF